MQSIPVEIAVAAAVPPTVEPPSAVDPLPDALPDQGPQEAPPPPAPPPKPRPSPQALPKRNPVQPARRAPVRDPVAVAGADVSPPAPPAAPSPAPATDEAVATWRLGLLAWLRAHQVYPDAARREGIEGRVVVRFIMDRNGVVQTVEIVAGSGASMLDGAALALLQNAHLSPPPRDSGTAITLPIRYKLTTAQ